MIMKNIKIMMFRFARGLPYLFAAIITLFLVVSAFGIHRSFLYWVSYVALCLVLHALICVIDVLT